jgi:large subunit ribosomal protein L22
MINNNKTGNEHMAKAKSTNLSISTKHSIEISRELRYKNTSVAKKILENVVSMKRAMPMRRFNQDVGHKKGMAAGRYPVKAATEFLKIVKSVEANAQNKGLNTTNLKITKIISNKASIPFTGGRQRTGTKRTNVEIEVEEVATKKNKEAKNVQKIETKPVVKSEDSKVEEKKNEVKVETPVEKKVEEPKLENEVEEKVEIKQKEQKVEKVPKIEKKKEEVKEKVEKSKVEIPKENDDQKIEKPNGEKLQ